MFLYLKKKVGDTKTQLLTSVTDINLTVIKLRSSLSSFFWPLNVFLESSCWGYEKLLEGFLHRDKLRETRDQSRLVHYLQIGHFHFIKKPISNKVI